MAKAGRSIVVFDLGGVLIDWDPRHLYRKLFAGDESAMEHFLATLCTHEWNRCQDAGRSFSEGARLLKAEHPDKVELIDAYGTRFDEMMSGPIAGSVEILAELRAGGTPLYLLSNFSPEVLWCRITRHRGGAMEPAGPARVERRLAAILAADVAGYSRLIEADEEGTLGRLKALRAELIDPKIAGHKGRIVKTTGDGLLVEFASVVDALRCAAELQVALAEGNASIPPD